MGWSPQLAPSFVSERMPHRRPELSAQALATVRNVRKGMVVAGSAALLAMAALVGREGLEFTPGLMTAMVTASSATAAHLVAGQLESKFVYTDWDNRRK